MLRVERLSFSFSEQQILYDLTFEICSGEFTAVLGVNGSGKTTLLKCLLGIYRPKSGHVFLEGKALKNYSLSELSRKISYVPQETYASLNYNAMDLLEMAGRHLNREEKFIRANEILKELGLSKHAFKNYSSLSGGQRQLIRIGQALIQDTPIMILDEPTNNLDYANQVIILDLCRKLSRNGKTIIMTSHQPQDVMNFCDSALLIKNGKLSEYGSVEKTLTSKSLYELYNIEVEITHRIPRYPPIILATKSKQNYSKGQTIWKIF